MVKIFLLIALSYTLAFGGDMLKIGSIAPDFDLKDAEGKTHKLSDYKGKVVALYFYPKNNTPGCTKEACNLRDNFDVLSEKNVVVLGISYDDQESHKEFTQEYELPFTLLSDSEKKVAEMYGAKGGFFSFIGPKRITYLIDKDGKILHLFDKVDAGNHAQQILTVLNKNETKPAEKVDTK
jgi:peroxiredoxin Q/BCP